MSFKTEITINVSQLKDIMIEQLKPLYPNHTVKDVRFVMGSSGDERFGSTEKTVRELKVELVPKNTTSY